MQSTLPETFLQRLFGGLIDLHAAISPKWPVDRHQPHILCNCVIHERICQRVVRLTDIAERTAQRRERDQKIEWITRTGTLQIQQPMGFWRQHFVQILRSLIAQESVAQHARAMQDTMQCAVFGTNLSQASLHSGAIGNIHLAISHPRRQFGLRRTACHNHPRICSLAQDVFCQQSTEATTTASDQVDAVGTPRMQCWR